MGASSGGISIKTESDKYELTQIVKDLFGLDFVQTDKFEDTRNPDKYYIVKTKDVITIYNTQLAERFFKKQDTSEIQVFIDYFNTPELIFAHERYDSGGTYSYSLISNGKLKRQFRSLSYETTIDFGEIEEVEKEWRNGEIKKFDLGDGEFETIIKNPKTGFECDEANLPQVILDKLQFDKLGFDGDDSKIVERAFFVKKENNKTDSSPAVKLTETNYSKKSWWKIWK